MGFFRRNRDKTQDEMTASAPGSEPEPNGAANGAPPAATNGASNANGSDGQTATAALSRSGSSSRSPNSCGGSGASHRDEWRFRQHDGRFPADTATLARPRGAALPTPRDRDQHCRGATAHDATASGRSASTGWPMRWRSWA